MKRISEDHKNPKSRKISNPFVSPFSLNSDGGVNSPLKIGMDDEYPKKSPFRNYYTGAKKDSRKKTSPQTEKYPMTPKGIHSSKKGLTKKKGALEGQPYGLNGQKEIKNRSVSTSNLNFSPLKKHNILVKQKSIKNSKNKKRGMKESTTKFNNKIEKEKKNFVKKKKNKNYQNINFINKKHQKRRQSPISPFHIKQNWEQSPKTEVKKKTPQKKPYHVQEIQKLIYKINPFSEDLSFYLQQISKICSLIFAYGQTYQLSHYYFKKVWDKLYEKRDKKILIFASISLALKITDSFIGKKFFQSIVYEENKKKHKKSYSVQSLFAPNKNQFFLEKFTERNKTTNRMEKYLRKLDKVWKNDILPKPNKIEMAEMELKICLSLNFKLAQKTYSSNIHHLTSCWDEFLEGNYKKYDDLLKFRTQKQTKKFSFLIQVVEVLFQKYSYRENQQLLVLATIYLIIRLSLQCKNTTFSEKAKILYNSQNFVFVDKSGANKIFLKFLEKLDIEFQKISPYCELILPLFYEKSLKLFYYSFPDIQNHNHSLFIHCHNEALFKA